MRVLLIALIGALALPLAACSSVGVPEGFPADQVPLQSTSLSAAEQSGQVWNLTVDGHGAQIDQAVEKLQQAGFTVVGQSKSDVGMTYSLASSQYSVRLGVSGDGESLTYGVAPRAGENSAATDVDDGVKKGEGQ